MIGKNSLTFKKGDPMAAVLKYDDENEHWGKRKIIIRANSVLFKPRGMVSCTGGDLFYRNDSPFVVLEYFDSGYELDRSRRREVPVEVVGSGTHVGLNFEVLGIQYLLPPFGSKKFFEKKVA